MDFINKKEEQIEAIRKRYNSLRRARPDCEVILYTLEYHQDLAKAAANLKDNFLEQTNALQANLSYTELGIMEFKEHNKLLKTLNNKVLNRAIESLEHSMRLLLQHYINLAKEYKAINELLNSNLENNKHVLTQSLNNLRNNSLDVYKVADKGFFTRKSLDKVLKDLKKINLNDLRNKEINQKEANSYNDAFKNLEKGVELIINITSLESRMQEVLAKSL